MNNTFLGDNNAISSPCLQCSVCRQGVAVHPKKTAGSMQKMKSWVINCLVTAEAVALVKSEAGSVVKSQPTATRIYAATVCLSKGGWSED